MSIIPFFNSKNANPLVSCLCLTENRTHLLKRAVTCFLSQTYPNKELIIVYRDHDLNTEEFINSLTDPQLKRIKVPSTPKLTLGELRNISIQKSSGDYFCQWDDDDWYHNKRLEIQLQSVKLNKKEGSVLLTLLFHNEVTDESYLSFQRPWENSIFCKKTIHKKFKYPPLDKQEDTAFVRNILNSLHAVTTHPLYIYVFHGFNTWNEQHFKDLFAKSFKLPPDLSKKIKLILSEEIRNNEASELLSGTSMLEQIDLFQNSTH